MRRAAGHAAAARPDGHHWGLGWELFAWPGGLVFGHDGGTVGQSAFLRIVPGKDVAIALLTNGGNPIAVYFEIFGHLLKELADIDLPATPVPPAEPRRFDASQVRRHLRQLDRQDRGQPRRRRPRLDDRHPARRARRADRRGREDRAGAPGKRHPHSGHPSTESTFRRSSSATTAAGGLFHPQRRAAPPGAPRPTSWTSLEGDKCEEEVLTTAAALSAVAVTVAACSSGGSSSSSSAERDRASRRRRRVGQASQQVRQRQGGHGHPAARPRQPRPRPDLAVGHRSQADFFLYDSLINFTSTGADRVRPGEQVVGHHDHARASP